MASPPRSPDAGPAPIRRADAELVEKLGLSGKSRALGIFVRGGLVLLLLGAVAFGIQQYRERQAESAEPTYKTAAVARRDVQVTITATGTLKGLNTVEVGAEVSGKVTVVHVDWNDRVTKGQVLAELDPEQPRATLDEATARVSEADASIRQARATLVEAKQTAARATTQIGQGLVSQQRARGRARRRGQGRRQRSRAPSRARSSRVRRSSPRARGWKRPRSCSPIDGIVLSRDGRARTDRRPPASDAGAVQARRGPRAHEPARVHRRGRRRPREARGSAATFTVDAYPGARVPVQGAVAAQRGQGRAERGHLRGRARGRQPRAAAAPGHDRDRDDHRRDPSRRASLVPNAALRFDAEVPKVRAAASLRPRAPKQAPRARPQKSERRVCVLDGGEPRGGRRSRPAPATAG